MSRRHRGKFKLRPITLSSGVQVLHIPRPGICRSSTVIIQPNGVITPLPWLAWHHGKPR